MMIMESVASITIYQVVVRSGLHTSNEISCYLLAHLMLHITINAIVFFMLTCYC